MADAKAGIVAWARYFTGQVPHFQYTQGANRMQDIGQWPLQYPITTDCSGFVTLCYYLAGAADPNGQSYNHTGYTGTLLAHGKHINASLVQPGDVVVYGPGTGEHTAIVVSVNKGDILTVSHGGPTGQSPIYCWVNPPRSTPAQHYPSDGRKPQTFLTFNTKVIRTPRTPS